jgi:hypothetical protein
MHAMTTDSTLLERLQIDAQELLALEGLSDQTDAAVFLGGSLVEGLGNRSSDVDVFVVGNAEPRGENVHHAAGGLCSVHMLGNRRVDFEYWSEAVVSRIARKLASLTLHDEGPDNVALERRLDEIEICLLHRIRVGVPLLNEPRLTALRARFDYARLARFLVEVKLREIDDALEDLYGMLDDGDVDVGILRARDLLNVVCEAYCHHRGNTNVRRKWRSKILASLARDPEASEVAEQFWSLQLEAGQPLRSDREAWRKHLESCMRFANQVTDRIIA